MNSSRKISLPTIIALTLPILLPGGASAQDYKFTTLTNFTDPNQGTHPSGPLIIDKAGNLYGTTAHGGTGKGGTVFKIDAATHALSTVASFSTATGWEPSGALALDARGDLYGTTAHGGASPENRPGYDGMGTIFKVDMATQTLTTLASFSQFAGTFPEGVAQDPSGHLYGTTLNNAFSTSTLFRVSAGTQTITTLITFDHEMGGIAYGVAVDRYGNLYGAGGSSRVSRFGYVFQVKAGTTTPVPIAKFSGEDGAQPNGSLVIDDQGNLYGTTQEGGPGHHGTVFKIEAKTRRLVTLAFFNGENGSSPRSGVTLDRQGNLYGSTAQGTDCQGAVFKVAAGTNILTTIARFTGANGLTPENSLTVDSQGAIYGTTQEGGAKNNGTVFMLTPQKAP